MAYLKATIAQFDEIERSYAQDALQFYIPRMRNPKSLIQDLAYVIQTIDANPVEGWGDDMRFQLIRVFRMFRIGSCVHPMGLAGIPDDSGPFFERIVRLWNRSLITCFKDIIRLTFSIPAPTVPPTISFIVLQSWTWRNKAWRNKERGQVRRSMSWSTSDFAGWKGRGFMPGIIIWPVRNAALFSEPFGQTAITCLTSPLFWILN